MSKPKYNRVVLKLSGEALAGEQGFGINPAVIKSVAEQVKEIAELDVEVAVVVGGGNIWRGKIGSEMGMDRAGADYMGMLATVMNSLALQDSLENIGIQTRVQTSIEMRQVAEPYIRRKAVRHLEKKRVVIFAAGTGNPYFSTDTTAALRAAEIEADVILMAKNNVDGVYNADPSIDPTATKYETLTYLDVLKEGLGVMDSTASSLCMDNDIPLIVIQPYDKTSIGDIEKAILKADLGLNPSNDGTVIRIAFPALTEERRRDLVKVVKKYAEEAKVAVRNVRRDGNDDLKKLEKAGEITEDDLRGYTEDIQKETDKYIAKVDEIAKNKEKEIMEV